jgi:hypothetical protein
VATPGEKTTLKRPVFVSVIAGILIVFSAYLLFELRANPSNRRLSLGILGIVFVYYLPMAFGLLAGKNWARILFLWFMSTSLLFQLRGELHGLLLANIIFYLGSAYFLTRPAAVGFFLPDAAAARWNNAAYGVVTLLIVLNFAGTFFQSTLKEGFEKLTQWSVETFHIGYLEHDIARLKLPSDWTQGFVLKEWAAIARQGDFEARAWGGLSAFGMSNLDLETGEITQREDSSSFTFEAGYLRADGTAIPCGLVRYQLTFSEANKDPLFQILQAQADIGGGKHQFYRSPEFTVVEFDDIADGMRFTVWNWQHSDDASHVYGMILGVPSSDPDQLNSCTASAIVDSLELEGADGTIWHATDLNTQVNPVMIAVSGITIDLDPASLWNFGVDGETFFPRLDDYLNHTSNLTVEMVSKFPPSVERGPELELRDVAHIYETGRGSPSPDDPWYLKTIGLHIDRCGSLNDLKDFERHYIKSAAESKIPFKLNCGR